MLTTGLQADRSTSVFMEKVHNGREFVPFAWFLEIRNGGFLGIAVRRAKAFPRKFQCFARIPRGFCKEIRGLFALLKRR